MGKSESVEVINQIEGDTEFNTSISNNNFRESGVVNLKIANGVVDNLQPTVSLKSKNSNNIDKNGQNVKALFSRPESLENIDEPLTSQKENINIITNIELIRNDNGQFLNKQRPTNTFSDPGTLSGDTKTEKAVIINNLNNGKFKEHVFIGTPEGHQSSTIIDSIGGGDRINTELSNINISDSSDLAKVTLSNSLTNSNSPSAIISVVPAESISRGLFEENQYKLSGFRTTENTRQF